MNRAALPAEPMWNDPEPEVPVIKWKTPMEERIDQKRRMKRLCDCTLPDGFRLVHSEPKQMWIEQQMRWAFQLGFEQRGRDEVHHIHRYEPSIPDVIQMNWAMLDFVRVLQLQGYTVGDGRPKDEPVKIKVPAGHKRHATFERMQLGMVH